MFMCFCIVCFKVYNKGDALYTHVHSKRDIRLSIIRLLLLLRILLLIIIIIVRLLLHRPARSRVIQMTCDLREARAISSSWLTFLA